VRDVTPFWELVAAPGHATVVHAGREEFRFCLRAVGKWPSQLLDVQLAAGLLGWEYPASYGTLVRKVLGKTLSKGETRTDWRQRPLVPKQIEYALQDVVYLPDLWSDLHGKLLASGRLEWLESEMQDWQAAIERADSLERWRRVSGISGLSARSLVIVRELWRWREQEASKLDRPPRRILRDDLIVELARRGSGDLRQIKAIRGIERSSAKRHLDVIAATIARALAQPRQDWPSTDRVTIPAQVNVLGQFLNTALTSVCRAQQLAPGLVGTAQDVRDLVAYQLGFENGSDGELPALSRGWRAQVVGQSLQNLLDGKTAIRIKNPLSDEPLSFEKAD
jgi:ribonuclease D